MRKLFSWVLIVMGLALITSIVFSGCATIQKAMEFVNPSYHEIILEMSGGRLLVLNAPMDWPAEINAFESTVIPIIYPLFDYAIQGDGYIYEIMLNAETLDIYALSKTPGVFYNFDAEKTVWYLYLDGKPIISDVKGFLKCIDEIVKMIQREQSI